MTEDEKEKAPAAPHKPKTTRLFLDGPSTCTSMNFPQDGGGMIVVNREGTDVPAKDAAALIEIAAKSGVRLRSN